jgi:hypothetical protein
VIGTVSELLPAEISAQSDLLIAGLSSLFDAAWTAASRASEIKFSVVPGPISSGSPSIDFVVDTIPKALAEAELRSDAHEEALAAEAGRSREIQGLCESIASNVATAHDGELTIEHHEGGYSMRRLRISNAG